MRHYIKTFALSLIAALACSCNNYIDIMPKGKQIPTTLEDFRVLMNYEYNVHYSPILQGLYLLNDNYVSKSYFTTDDLRRANYMWDEKADRITLNQSDEGTYFYSYAAINVVNLVIENAPTATDATDAERAEAIAYAKAIRAQCYYILVNFYADQYDKATASTTLGVPVITSADVDAPYTQMTVQQVYDFILNDLNEALANGLPETAVNILMPNKATAHAMLARVYMSMGEYDKALDNANKALAYNDKLYNWNEFYDSYQEAIEMPESYNTIPTPMNYTYVENYNFRSGDKSPNSTSADLNMSTYRAAKFEDGDAKFMARWKYRVNGQNTYYQGCCAGNQNYMGLTTVEMYLDKAECLARKGQIEDAMKCLNDVRVTRIRPDKYQPATAANLAEAIAKIRLTKENELVYSIVEYADHRRFNHEGTYATTLDKEYEGTKYTLKPDSHLWTMVFPALAVNNHGNGSITQNSK